MDQQMRERIEAVRRRLAGEKAAGDTEARPGLCPFGKPWNGSDLGLRVGSEVHFPLSQMMADHYGRLLGRNLKEGECLECMVDRTIDGIPHLSLAGHPGHGFIVLTPDGTLGTPPTGGEHKQPHLADACPAQAAIPEIKAPADLPPLTPVRGESYQLPGGRELTITVAALPAVSHCCHIDAAGVSCARAAALQVWSPPWGPDDYTEVCADHVKDVRRPGDAVVNLGEEVGAAPDDHEAVYEREQCAVLAERLGCPVVAMAIRARGWPEVTVESYRWLFPPEKP